VDYKDFCRTRYDEIFEEELAKSACTSSEARERFAQKAAIGRAGTEAMLSYRDVSPDVLWKCIHTAHIARKSGVSISSEQVEKVVSAENSWKKSSGHAFEEMICRVSESLLQDTDISFVLQRDLSRLIGSGAIANDQRDMTWLADRMESGAFDLYAIVQHDGRQSVFGCIQSKTSIRDRVTRDREPSIQAMEAFFWSIAVVLDGDFLRMPKFKGMVNGGTALFPKNGWHGVYVFSDIASVDRIYADGVDTPLLRAHAIEAANQWLHNRQWFDQDWRGSEIVSI